MLEEELDEEQYTQFETERPTQSIWEFLWSQRNKDLYGDAAQQQSNLRLTQGLDAFETTLSLDLGTLAEVFNPVNGKLSDSSKMTFLREYIKSSSGSSKKNILIKSEKAARTWALREWRKRLQNIASCDDMLCGLGLNHKLARVSGKLPYSTHVPSTVVRCSLMGCTSGDLSKLPFYYHCSATACTKEECVYCRVDLRVPHAGDDAVQMTADIIRSDNEHPFCVGTCQRICKTTICPPCYFDALTRDSRGDKVEKTVFAAMSTHTLCERVRRRHRPDAGNYFPLSTVSPQLPSGAPLLPPTRTITAWEPQHVEDVADFINACVFSPDGRMLLTAHHDGDARVWNVATGKEERGSRFLGHMDSVRCGSWSFDGSCVCTGGYDGTARVWVASTGQELACLRGHARFRAVSAVAWMPVGRGGGVSASSSPGTKLSSAGMATNAAAAVTGTLTRRLLTACHDGWVCVWDLASIGRPLLRIRAHELEVRDAQWSPDGSKIITCSRDGTLKFWDAQSGEELRSVSVHDTDVRTCRFSPDGTLVCTASDDGTVRLFDRHGRQVRSFKNPEKLSPMTSATFSPDGSHRLLTTSWDTTALVWDYRSGNLLRALDGQADSLRGAQFSPDGTTIATFGRGASVQLHRDDVHVSLEFLRQRGLHALRQAWDVREMPLDDANTFVFQIVTSLDDEQQEELLSLEGIRAVFYDSKNLRRIMTWALAHRGESARVFNVLSTHLHDRPTVARTLLSVPNLLPSLLRLAPREIESMACTPLCVAIMNELLCLNIVANHVIAQSMLLALYVGSYLWVAANIQHHGGLTDADITGLSLLCVAVLCTALLTVAQCRGMSRRGLLGAWAADGWNICTLITLGLSVSVLVLGAFGPDSRTSPQFTFIAASGAFFVWTRVLGFLRILNMKFATFVLSLFQILRDIASFCVVLVIWILAFASVLYVVYCSADPDSAASDQPFQTVGDTLFTMYRVMLGDYSDEWSDAFESKASSQYTKIVFVVYMFLGTIVMLNVLIAVVSDSYDGAIARARGLFLRARLQFVAEMDATFALTAATYASHSLDGADGPSGPQKGDGDGDLGRISTAAVAAKSAPASMNTMSPVITSAVTTICTAFCQCLSASGARCYGPFEYCATLGGRLGSPFETGDDLAETPPSLSVTGQGKYRDTSAATRSTGDAGAESTTTTTMSQNRKDLGFRNFSRGDSHPIRSFAAAVRTWHRRVLPSAPGVTRSLLLPVALTGDFFLVIFFFCLAAPVHVIQRLTKDMLLLPIGGSEDPHSNGGEEDTSNSFEGGKDDTQWRGRALDTERRVQRLLGAAERRLEAKFADEMDSLGRVLSGRLRLVDEGIQRILRRSTRSDRDRDRERGDRRARDRDRAALGSDSSRPNQQMSSPVAGTVTGDGTTLEVDISLLDVSSTPRGGSTLLSGPEDRGASAIVRVGSMEYPGTAAGAGIAGAPASPIVTPSPSAEIASYSLSPPQRQQQGASSLSQTQPMASMLSRSGSGGGGGSPNASSRTARGLSGLLVRSASKEGPVGSPGASSPSVFAESPVQALDSITQEAIYKARSGETPGLSDSAGRRSGDGGR